jgi:Xaa-Pro aminopeptidase
VFKKGDLVQLGLSARVDGYSACVSRPLFLGKMPLTLRKKIEFGKLAHEKTMEWLKAGVKASDVADAYYNFFVSNGYERNYLYGPCHGLGMIEVEPPWMESTSDYIIQENMTFQVDTFFLDTSFGFRWENGIRIIKGGVEKLSFENMRLIEIQ